MLKQTPTTRAPIPAGLHLIRRHPRYLWAADQHGRYYLATLDERAVVHYPDAPSAPLVAHEWREILSEWLRTAMCHARMMRHSRVLAQAGGSSWQDDDCAGCPVLELCWGQV